MFGALNFLRHQLMEKSIDSKHSLQLKRGVRFGKSERAFPGGSVCARGNP